MKVVIFAGGFGSRLGSLTSNTPKPLIKINGIPIIWHIMKYYSKYGLNDFIILGGFKHKVLQNYFTKNKKKFSTNNLNWKIKVVNTGKNTMTGGRLKRIKNFLIDNEDFCLTYGDGLSDVNIKQQIKFHKKNKKLATILAVHPPGRFGLLNIKKKLAVKFTEKPINNANVGWINGGYFILSKKVIDLIKDDQSVWERKPLETLAKNKQLSAFKHEGFWKPMDTIRDKKDLEGLIKSKKAPWIKW
jgi:glucose-1-phosphate cytidylyltransferase